jgi:ribulose 1,5-bisphosphate synthetase/thiazole synthase
MTPPPQTAPFDVDVDVDVDVAIVGAGPVGLVLAILLAQLGR